MRKLRVLVLLCLLCLLAAPALAEKTTVMVYMCGSNLESLYGSASADMQEMLVSGFDPQEVNLVVMAGGSTAWQDSTFTPDRLTIAVAQPRKRGSGLRFTAVETLPNASMGESDTLLAFLSYARSSYPADRYALVLWDHGGGPLHGVCWDELYDADSLSLQEVTSALERAGLGGEDKLYFIGFDACLMGSVEVASAMAPYAECMIASEETEPGLGWNYAFLGEIAADATAADTGRHIVDGYFSAQQGTASVLTMACYDLSAVEEVSRAAEAFFGALGNVDTENYIIHAEARRAARGYGRTYRAARALETNGDYDLVDLRGLLAADCYADAEGAAELRAALDAMVIYSNSNAKGSGGISIFYPYYEPERFAADNSAYAAYTVSEAYLRYLTDFVSVQLGSTLADWNGLVIESDETQDNFTLTLTPEQAQNTVKAELLVLRGQVGDNGMNYSLVSRTDAGLPDESGILYARNPRKMLVNDVNHRMIPYLVSDDGRYGVRISTKGDFSTKGILQLMDAGDGSLTVTDYFMYDHETDALTNRHSFDILGQDKWIIVCPTYVPDRDDSGAMRGFDQWQPYWDVGTRESNSPDCMHFSFADIHDEPQRLFAVWQVTDTQSNTWSSDMVELYSAGNQTVNLIPRTTDGPLQITGGWVTSRRGQIVDIALELTNVGKHALQIDDPDRCIVLSGQYVDKYLEPIGGLNLAPGQTVTLYQEYDAGKLYGLQEISSVTIRRSVTDIEAFTIEQMTLSADTAEVLPLVHGGKVSKTDQPLAEGGENGLHITVLTATAQVEGALKLDLLIRNDSDEVRKYDRYPPELKVNGQKADKLRWYFCNPDGTPVGILKIPPHSTRIVSLVMGGRIRLINSVHKSGMDLAEMGIQTLDSITLQGITLEFCRSILVPKSIRDRQLLYSRYHHAMFVDEMRVEPLRDHEGQLWVVGLHVTEENQIDALDMFGVQTWYINGRRAFKYAGTGAFGEYITVGSFGKETTWLYFVTDELPAEGVSSIGMTFHQTNRNYKKYCPVTVTVTSDIPLDGKGRQSMYAGALHTSIAVDGIELIDEPAWQQVSFEGTLQVGETVLRAEIIDAGITDNAHLTGWLRLTNDTDQYLRTCAILDTMFVNQVQQIADYLAIDAGIEAHTVTWQRIDIPLYANYQLVDGELNAELDTAQQILGFGPEMLGLESITEIDSTSDEEEYLCRLHLYATEPLPVPHGEPVTGETVLETQDVRIELLAARTVATDSGVQVYTILRCANLTDSDVRFEAGAPDTLENRYLLSRKGMTGICLFSWDTAGSAEQVQVQFRLGYDVSDVITMQSTDGFDGGTVWAPALQINGVNSSPAEEYYGVVSLDNELSFSLPDSVPFRVTDVWIHRYSDIAYSNIITIEVMFENLTDTDYTVASGMIALNGVTYQDNNWFELPAYSRKLASWDFGKQEYYTKLINTPVIHDICLPLSYTDDDKITGLDIINGIYPNTMLQISCDAAASCVNENMDIIGRGELILNGEQHGLEVLSVKQTADGQLTFRCLADNNTDHMLKGIHSLEDRLTVDGAEIYPHTVPLGLGGVCALPGTRSVFEFTIYNQLITQYYYTDRKWNIFHPMLADGLKQSGLAQFTQFCLSSEGSERLKEAPFVLRFKLDEPFTLHTPDRHTAAALINWEGWKAEVLSLTVMNDETNGRGLCMLVRVANEGGDSDINPGVTSWLINGERMRPDRADFFPKYGPLDGTSRVVCLFMDIPEGVEEISELKLFCVLNDYWPNKDDGLAEIVLSEPLSLDHSYTIPGGDLTIIPAEF